MLVKDIFAKEVIDSLGNRVGKISDMDVDISKGIIRHAVLSTGMLKKKDLKLDKIKNIGDTVILNCSKEDI